MAKKYAVSWLEGLTIRLACVEAENEYEALLKAWLKYHPIDLRDLAIQEGYSKVKRIEEVKEGEVREYLSMEWDVNEILIEECS